MVWRASGSAVARAAGFWREIKIVRRLRFRFGGSRAFVDDVLRNERCELNPSSITTTTTQPPRIVLKSRKALPFFSHHPWVFASAVAHVEGNAEPGDVVTLVTGGGEFIAHGLYNPASNLTVRLYSWDVNERLEREFWSQRIDEALSLRAALYPDFGSESACRLIFSEADGLSGLIVDRYGDWLLMQFTSLAMFQRRDLLISLLQEKLKPQGIWLRTEKGTRDMEQLEAADGLVLGSEPPRPLFVEENGVRYAVDVVEGQKTGFFLDQRDNRLAAAKYFSGARVLDMFCYSGAFSLVAAKVGGAKEVRGYDVSASAVALATANAEANGVADRVRFEKGDSFATMSALQERGEMFDAVVLDPPRMTRRRSGVDKALRGYFSLNMLGCKLLKPGGILVTCSCSGLIDRIDFEEMLGAVSLKLGRRIQILEARGASADHPTSVHCPESRYLKCYICRVI